jgi:hypothetical protein
MNAHGHEEIAEVAGIPCMMLLLKGKRTDNKENNKWLTDENQLRAFYLGNWLTDYSQVIDPVSIYKLVYHADEIIDSLINSFETLSRTVMASLGSDNVASNLKKNVEQKVLETSWKSEIVLFLNKKRNQLLSFKRRLLPKIKKIIADPNDLRRSYLFDTARMFVKIKGYFTFCDPKSLGKAHLDPKSYFEIFDVLFGQYYPHEHFDRPLKVDDVTKYDDAPDPEDSTMYAYLSQSKKYIADLLLELEFTYFSKIVALEDKDSLSKEEQHLLNLNLAKFGHAIHAVEDFFAHSNFVEQVAIVHNDLIPVEDDQLYFFSRRLAKTNDPKSSPKPDEYIYENKIVTGSFDFKDTAISLSHLLGWDHVFEKKEPAETGTWENLFNEFIEDLGNPLLLQVYRSFIIPFDQMNRLIDNLYQLFAHPEQNRENPLFKKFKDIEEVLESYGDDAIESIGKKQLSDETRNWLLKDSFYSQPENKEIGDLVIKYVLSVWRLIKVCKTTYRASKVVLFLVELLTMPEVTLAAKTKAKLRDVAKDKAIEIAMDKLKSQVLGSALQYALSPVDTLVFASRELWYHSFERDRLGCHSLLAKDHETDFLYKPMMECAKAVHYVIVEKMMRPRLSGNEYCDWHELIDFYLSHPNYMTTETGLQEIVRIKGEFKFISCVHQIKGKPKTLAEVFGDIESDPNISLQLLPKVVLSKTFNANNLSSDDEYRYLLQCIYPSMEVDGSCGLLDWPFPEGSYLVIPTETIFPVRDVQLIANMPKLWYKDVIVNGWEIFRGYNRKTNSIIEKENINQFYRDKVIDESQVSYRLNDKGASYSRRVLENNYIATMKPLYKLTDVQLETFKTLRF